jgi:hypothetical protein
MSDDLRNVFERRKPQTSLANDRVNRFERHQQVVDARRRNTSAHDNRVQRREADRDAWTHRSDTPRTSSGLAAGAELTRLKAASDASRNASNKSTTAATVISGTALTACVESWLRHSLEGQTFHCGNPEIDSFNDSSLNRSIQHHLKSGWMVSVELITAAHAWALAENHFDTRRRDAEGNIVSIRGDRHLSPPTMCPPCIWPDEARQLAQEETEQVVADRLAQDAANQKKSFDQLQREARRNFKAPLPGGPAL